MVSNLPISTDSRESLARDVGAVARIGAVPSMLQMVCDETGMGFAAVARVTDSTWTACAVHDSVGFGLKPGGQLELRTTLCFESRAARVPIIVDRFSEDATYRDHHTPAIYGLESYISVPIVLPSGEYFGNLCAIDSRPARVSESRIVRMFEVFANLIAMQLDNERQQWLTEAQLTTERETAGLREQFIAVLAHDLRSPLAAVHANAEILSRRQDDPSLANVGRRLKATAIRMARLIDDVMDFARGRLGAGMAMTLAPVDDLTMQLGQVIDELEAANQSRIVTRDLVVEQTVHCDVVRLQQLLSNLLANALTHGASDSPIHVHVGVDEAYLVISVTNRGEPIEAHLLARIFEPYWRPPTSAPINGLGLGLYICKQIAEAHSGTVDVTSSAQRGTCFVVRIPLSIPRL